MSASYLFGIILRQNVRLTMIMHIVAMIIALKVEGRCHSTAEAPSSHGDTFPCAGPDSDTSCGQGRLMV